MNITDPIHEPFVVRTKILMQEARMGADGWDEELPYHLKREWKDSSKSLENLTVSEGRHG